jgi:ABC-type Zn2+ transport system substrate-binding protein/surface adhesin
VDRPGPEAAAVDVPVRDDHDDDNDHDNDHDNDDHDNDNDDHDNDNDDHDNDDNDNDKHDNGTALLHRCVHVCLDGGFLVADEQYMLRFWLLLLAAIDLWNDGRRDARRHLRRVGNTPWPISGTLG